MSVQFVFAFKDILAEVVKNIRDIMLGYSDVPLNIASQVLYLFGNCFKTEILINIKYKRIDVSIIGDFDNQLGIVKVCL